MSYQSKYDSLDHLKSVLKLDQQYKLEEMYIKDLSITDKNELLNSIKNIYQGLSISAETMEYIYNNNFKFNNNEQNTFSDWSNNEVLYKLGKESPLFQKSTSLYYNLIKNITNEGKEINNDNNINEDIEMKIEENTINEKDIKQNKLNVNSLCDDLEKALEEYKKAKKIEKEKTKKMEIENKEKDGDNKKVLVDNNVVMVFRNENECLKKLKNIENLF
jgi:hypothetical protein